MGNVYKTCLRGTAQNGAHQLSCPPRAHHACLPASLALRAWMNSRAEMVWSSSAVSCTYYLCQWGQVAYPLPQFLHLQKGLTVCFTSCHENESKHIQHIKQYLACRKHSMKGTCHFIISQPSGTWITCHAFRSVFLYNKEAGRNQTK